MILINQIRTQYHWPAKRLTATNWLLRSSEPLSCNIYLMRNMKLAYATENYVDE
ncbi:hypothetical protein CHS0354_036978, partial [Potamilus streckersoni]